MRLNRKVDRDYTWSPVEPSSSHHFTVPSKAVPEKNPDPDDNDQEASGRTLET